MLYQFKIRMVLRWLNPAGSGPHALYSTKYDDQRYEYHCINSWAEDPNPIIPMREVYAVDYISIVQPPDHEQEE